MSREEGSAGKSKVRLGRGSAVGWDLAASVPLKVLSILYVLYLFPLSDVSFDEKVKIERNKSFNHYLQSTDREMYRENEAARESRALLSI